MHYQISFIAVTISIEKVDEWICEDKEKFTQAPIRGNKINIKV